MPTFQLLRVRSNGQTELSDTRAGPGAGRTDTLDDLLARYGPPEFVLLELHDDVALLLAVHGFYVLTWGRP